MNIALISPKANVHANYRELCEFMHSSDFTEAFLSEYSGLSIALPLLAALTPNKHVVEIVDGYLLATVMLIFALGLYELFISKIDMAENDETSSNVLMITSLDDLKGRLAKVILMILIVKFFEHAIKMSFNNPLDLLYLAGGITLIGLAIYLSHAGEHPQKT